MRKTCLITVVILIVVASAGLVMANKATDGAGWCITISPKTLYLGSVDTVVSVHSNIPYGLVDTSSLSMDGILPTYTKYDACGDLVVKFDRADVKQIVSPGSATLTLSGLLKDGEFFEASDTIIVKK